MNNIFTEFIYVWNVKFTSVYGLKIATFRPIYSIANNKYFKLPFYFYNGSNLKIKKHIYKLNNLIVSETVKDICKIPEEYSELLDYNYNQSPDFPENYTIVDLTKYV